uniref:Uncharacterized protein n=1 Tax=candidate division WOR-3 bacterium TaxID=2052148 RepID=A0A7V3NTL9_UNCW3
MEMPNLHPTSEEKKENLRKLFADPKVGQKRKKYLYYIFQGMSIIQVAEKLVVGESSVRNEMTAIYHELNLAGLNGLLEQYKLSFQELYPSIKDIEGKSEVSEVGRNAPEVYRHPHPPRTIEVPYWLAAMIGGVFVILIGLVIISFLNRNVHAILPTSTEVAFAALPTNVPTNPPLTITNIPAIAPIPTTKTTIPTNIPSPSQPPTEIPTPSETPTSLPTMTPTPSLALPFLDNFDNGLRPEWQVVKGEPMFINGRVGRTSGELRLSLGDTALSNYTLEFDYYNLRNCANCIFVEMVIGTKINLSLVGGAIGGDFSRLSAFDNSQWEDLITDSVSKEGHVKLQILGNHFNLFLDSIPSEPVIYGSESDTRGPIVVTINNGAFIDNFSLSGQ